MLCLTVVILFFTAVQAYNAIGCRQFGEQPQIRENRERSDEQMRESSAGGSSSTSTATATTDAPDKGFSPVVFAICRSTPQPPQD